MELHLTPALEQRLDHLAAQTQRTPEELAQEGMETFLDYEERSLAMVTRGRAEIAAGQVVEHQEVVTRIQQIRNR